MNNYGFIVPKIEENNYILGGLGSLPKVVLQPDSDWTDYLPKYEKQRKNFDTYNCTGFGNLNLIEIYLNRVTKQNYNFSDRFTGIVAGTFPPGNDPHKVAESIRKKGLIPDEMLPFEDVSSVEEYYSYKGTTEAKCAVEGQRWLRKYEFKHQWLWTKNQTKEQRIDKIMRTLKYSPIGISVSAWYQKNNVYVDNGLPNNHWCVVYGVADNGFKVFDSYDQSKKILSFDHNIQFAKSIYLSTKSVKKNWLIELLKSIIKFK